MRDKEIPTRIEINDLLFYTCGLVFRFDGKTIQDSPGALCVEKSELCGQIHTHLRFNLVGVTCWHAKNTSISVRIGFWARLRQL